MFYDGYVVGAANGPFVMPYKEALFESLEVKVEKNLMTFKFRTYLKKDEEPDPEQLVADFWRFMVAQEVNKNKQDASLAAAKGDNDDK